MTGVFAFAVTGFGNAGNKNVVYGTWTASGGSTGGAIVTGLKKCEFITLTYTGTTAHDNTPAAAIVGGTATIKVKADGSGIWKAEGY